MDGYKRYKITCVKCKKQDHVLIKERSILYESGAQTNLTSSRFRPDKVWGFECICGNYDLLAHEESKDFDKLISGTPSRIAEIANILSKKPIKRFSMEAV